MGRWHGYGEATADESGVHGAEGFGKEGGKDIVDEVTGVCAS
jgi:hypothetical protein